MSTSIKKLLSNKTYCALPFIHRHRDLDGKNYLCCYASDDPSQAITGREHRQQIQKNILQGIPVSNCKKCYHWEQAGTISPRIKETIEYTRNPVIEQNLKESAEDINRAQVLSYDIRFDNKCNLACIGCGPGASSLWAKKKGIEIVRLIDYNLEDFAAISSSQRVYFAGGEPLINDRVYELLCQIAKNDHQPAVVINSNIASIKPRFFEIFKQLKHLSIMVSIDGYGSVTAYHRWPTQWPKFYENLVTLNRMEGVSVSWNTVIDAVSIWGLADLLKIESLTTDWNLRVLDHPDSLSLNNLSDNLKPAARDQLNAIMSSRFFNQKPIFKTRIQLARDRLEQPGDPILLSNYINELDQQRNLNHQNYLGVKLT